MVFIKIGWWNIVVVISMEFVEINEPSFFVGVLLLRRVLKPHLMNMSIYATVIKESLEVGVRKRVVVRQRHLVDMEGVYKILFGRFVLVTIASSHA